MSESGFFVLLLIIITIFASSSLMYYRGKTEYVLLLVYLFYSFATT